MCVVSTFIVPACCTEAWNKTTAAVLTWAAGWSCCVAKVGLEPSNGEKGAQKLILFPCGIALGQLSRTGT